MRLVEVVQRVGTYSIFSTGIFFSSRLSTIFNSLGIKRRRLSPPL